MTGTDDQRNRFRVHEVPLLSKLDRVAFALTGDRQAAEDLVQDTVLRGLRYFDSFGEGDFRAWMIAIMRNLARERRRSIATADEDWLEQQPDPAPSAEQVVIARENQARLDRLVAALPHLLRETLVLREFGELTYAQIAAMLEVPVGTVMSRLARARETLRVGWLADEKGAAR